jgi:hypothetical protein
VDRRDWLKICLSGTAVLVGGGIPSLQARIEPPKGFRIGLDAVDDYVGCLRRGDLMTFFGQPGSGKTILAQKCAFENAKDGHKVAYVTDETLRRVHPNLKRIELPFSFANYKAVSEFKASLMGFDLVVWDGMIPVRDDWKSTMMKSKTNTLLQLLNNEQSYAVFIPTQRPILGDSSFPIIKSAHIHYVSSMIFKISKDPTTIALDVVKNRFGFIDMSFRYSPEFNGRYFDLVPVPQWKI